jgi:hypothetical protein
VDISALVTDALKAVETISSSQWQTAVKTGLADVQAKSPVLEDALDVGAALVPQLAAIDALYKIYVGLGGKPADVNDLVWRRSTDDPYDPEGAHNE